MHLGKLGEAHGQIVLPAVVAAVLRRELAERRRRRLLGLERVAEAMHGGPRLPTGHLDGDYPIPEPTIKTGVLTMSLAVLELLGK